MLSAAFSECTGWEERYLAEATKEEEKISFDLQENIIDLLIPVTNSNKPNVGAVRRSRLVSGLNLEPLPGTTEGNEEAVEALRNSLLKSDWITTVLQSSDNITIGELGMQVLDLT